MDALGSLRGVVNPTGGVLEGQHYTPYGTPFGHTGTAQTAFGFTGEQTDPNGLLNLRARYYVPGLGVFPSLDPVEEGNRYGYVGGNVVNRVDPSGMVGERPDRTYSCQQEVVPCGGDQITGNPKMDEWATQLGMCKQGYRNDDTATILSQFQSIFGLLFPQGAGSWIPKFALPFPNTINRTITEWQWEELAAIGRGAWLTARALQSRMGGLGEFHFSAAFGGTKLIKGGETLQSAIAISSGAAAVVPPHQFGGDGTTIYFRPGLNNSSVFIHELGHVIDFRLGSDYVPETFFRSSNPSTEFRRSLNTYYNRESECFKPSTRRNLWGLCIVQGMGDYLFMDKEVEKPPTTPYGFTNHFEDFAESWMQWVLFSSKEYWMESYEPIVNEARIAFMEAHVPDYIIRLNSMH